MITGGKSDRSFTLNPVGLVCKCRHNQTNHLDDGCDRCGCKRFVQRILTLTCKCCGKVDKIHQSGLARSRSYCTGCSVANCTSARSHRGKPSASCPQFHRDQEIDPAKGNIGPKVPVAMRRR